MKKPALKSVIRRSMYSRSPARIRQQKPNTKKESFIESNFRTILVALCAIVTIAFVFFVFDAHEQLNDINRVLGYIDGDLEELYGIKRELRDIWNEVKDIAPAIDNLAWRLR